jgi:hypothetical protein
MKKTDKTGRRKFLQASGATLAGSAIGVTSLAAAGQSPDSAQQTSTALQNLLRKATVPAARGPRVIVVGGGWSGLTMAKYLKRFNPDFDVILIDKQSAFVSFPGWLTRSASIF